MADSTPHLVFYADLCDLCRACEHACALLEVCPTPEGSRLLVCGQCSVPGCVDACISGAITARENGVVAIDGVRCVGCRMCNMVCPIGAIWFASGSGTALKCSAGAACRVECVDACTRGALSLRTETEERRRRQIRRIDAITGMGQGRP